MADDKKPADAGATDANTENKGPVAAAPMTDKGAPPADAPAKSDEPPKSDTKETPATEETKPADEKAGAKAGEKVDTPKESVSDLADLKDIASDAPDADAAAIAQQPSAPLREQQLDQQGRAYATGRRKDAKARVWIKPGKGKITINGREQEVYFARPTLRLVINQPFGLTDREGQYDVIATVKGGGLSGQAGAVKHGIAQALTRFEPALRSVVKAEGFLTRDSRVVERKKYGRAKARRSFQFSKR